MKLLINATSIASDKFTGIERFALRMSQELYNIDSNVDIFSTKNIPGLAVANHGSRFLSAGEQLLGKYEYLLRALWDQTYFRYHVIKSRPDIVFFPIQEGMLFPPVKQIVTIHDLHYLHFDESLSECSPEIGSFRKYVYSFKMPRIISDSTAVITVSESTRRDVIERFGVSAEKIHVIYNGYDESRFRVIIEPEPVLHRYGLKNRTYFIFIGSILRHKNLVRLAQAFSMHNNDTKLVIVGACKDVGYLKELMNTANSLGISDRVHYLDYVPDDDLPYLLNGAVAFLMPSLHEGFGVPLIEAMACGTPVITSNCSAMPEVAGDAALLVDPNSVESISSAMNQLVEEPQRAIEMIKAGLERVRMFGWSYSAQKLYDICEMESN